VLPRIAAIALLTVLIASAASDAQPPKISKPRPVPADRPMIVQPLPPASFDNQLQIGGDDLKARERSTRLTVEVGVNGRGPYRFVVDSGADTSVVGLRIARDLQLPLGTPAILNSITARQLVDRVRVAELKLGPSSVRDLQLPALRESDVGGDGLIGIDALAKQRLMMDFEKKRIRIEDARRPSRSEPGEIVVLARQQKGQLILTQVSAGRVRLDAIVDTGSEVTIGNSALRRRLVRANQKFWKAEATGVTGVTVDIDMAIVPEVRIGPVTFYDVPMAFADVPPFQLFGVENEPALLMGTDLLSTFRKVSLDFRARKVRFQLRRCEASGIVLNTTPSFSTRTYLRGDPSACA
jgi:hypothetical protein